MKYGVEISQAVELSIILHLERVNQLKMSQVCFNPELQFLYVQYLPTELSLHSFMFRSW